MINKVRQYIITNQMLKRNEKVVLGVSGGADSVCLFYIFLMLKKEYNLELHVVHVNHMMRGHEADADEQYVRELCEENQVAYHAVKRDMVQYARLNHVSQEEAGRDIRYEAFQTIKEEYHCDVIAVAHNSNDCAETMIFQLARGSGLTGLSSIPCKRGEIIRPLLTCTRREIEEFLKEREIPFRTDATNLEDHYTRNRIRLHVLPYLEQKVNRQAISHIANASTMLREVSDYLDRQTELFFKKAVIVSDDVYIIARDVFLQEDIVLQKSLVRRIIGKVSGKLKDISSTHIEQVCELVSKRVGKQIDLPYAILACVDYQRLLIGKKEKVVQYVESAVQCKTSVFVKKGFEYPLSVEDSCQGEVNLTFDEGAMENDYIFRYNVVDAEQMHGERKLQEKDDRKTGIQLQGDNSKKSMINEENLYTKCFDYDKIKNTVQLRTRKEGDYFEIGKMGGSKKLKTFFVDSKIPRQNRDHIPVLADGSHIMWIVGSRMSEAYKVSKSTKKILIVDIFGGNRDGRQDKGITE